ncbi:MAG: hypothetical protein ABIU63_16670 [Chitinophagaceae bacterium]
MCRFLLLLLFIFSPAVIFSQASDFITVKKRNNRTIKSFFPGVYIAFQTFDKRYAAGIISAIRNDSVFVTAWDIRPMYTSLGIPMADTVGTYTSGFHFKEIQTVDVSNKMKLQQLTPGRILIIGGAGYALLNLINGAYLHESITSSKNLKSLGIAAGAVGTGMLTNYLLRKSKKYRVEYVHMNDLKKQLRGF